MWESRDFPCVSAVVFPPREVTGSEGALGAGGPRSALSDQLWKLGGSSFPVRPGMSASTVAVSVPTSHSLFLLLFADLVHFSPPPPIVPSRPVK